MAYDGPDPKPVTAGGTGHASLLNHSVVVGSNTAPMTQLAVGTNGQVLIGSTGADPAFSTLTSTGGTILFTPGAHTLNLESTASTIITGTWTPVVTFAGSQTGITYTSNIGAYVKIGVLVYISCFIVMTNKGSSTGAAAIEGLPFTVASNPPQSTATISMLTGNITFPAASPIIGLLGQGGTTMGLFNSSTTGEVNISNTNFTNTAHISFCGIYLTNP